MGLFRRTQLVEATVSPTLSTASVATVAALTQAQTFSAGRERAMRVPTISRARDLLCGLVASRPLEHYVVTWGADGETMTQVAPEPWMVRPEVRVTRAHTLAWLTDDLIMYGSALLMVTERRVQDGRPARFLRIPRAQVSIECQAWADNVPLGDYTASWNGTRLDTRQLVWFWSPVQGLLDVGARAILTAERLDQAAIRFASSPTGFGILKQVNGEPLSGEELQQLAEDWVTAADLGAVRALNSDLTWDESTMNPSKLQLIEARQHQATELCRVANISPGLVGAPTGSGMTYANVEQQREQLRDDVRPYVACLEETFSDEQVTARGHVVRLGFEQPHADTQPTEPTPGAAQ